MIYVDIYGLINPIDNHVFYIGCTENLKARYSAHKSPNDTTAKAKKVAEIKSLGYTPELLHLDTVTVFEASFYEDYYMDLFRSFGFNLCQTMKSNYTSSKVFRTYYWLYFGKRYEYLDQFIHAAPPEWKEVLTKMHGYTPKPKYEKTMKELDNLFNGITEMIYTYGVDYSIPLNVVRKTK